jgi:hypothetical protein
MFHIRVQDSKIDDVREQGVEENIWTWEEG